MASVKPSGPLYIPKRHPCPAALATQPSRVCVFFNQLGLHSLGILCVHDNDLKGQQYETHAVSPQSNVVGVIAVLRRAIVDWTVAVPVQENEVQETGLSSEGTVDNLP